MSEFGLVAADMLEAAARIKAAARQNFLDCGIDPASPFERDMLQAHDDAVDHDVAEFLDGYRRHPRGDARTVSTVAGVSSTTNPMAGIHWP